MYKALLSIALLICLVTPLSAQQKYGRPVYNYGYRNGYNQALRDAQFGQRVVPAPQGYYYYQYQYQYQYVPRYYNYGYGYNGNSYYYYGYSY